MGNMGDDFKALKRKASQIAMVVFLFGCVIGFIAAFIYIGVRSKV